MSNTLESVGRFDWHSVIESTGDTSPDVIEALDEYFKVFAAPPPAQEGGSGFLTTHPCLKCGTPLMGMLGAFTWGIAHGEGFCGKCHWPARGHHFIIDKDGKDLMSLRNFVLQYHPDFVTKKKAL